MSDIIQESLSRRCSEEFEVITDQPFGRESIEKHGVISNASAIILIEVYPLKAIVAFGGDRIR